MIPKSGTDSLQLIQEEAGRVATVASAVLQEPFDVNRFRLELTEKLRQLSYPQPPERSVQRKTFYERLREFGALDELLKESTLTAIHRCRMLREIARCDRVLVQEKRSIHGHSLDFHNEMREEIDRHIKQIGLILSAYGVDEGWVAAEYWTTIYSQLKKEARALVDSKYPGSRKELLNGRVSEDLAAREAVYSVLKTILNGKKGLSGRFLCQLAILICSTARFYPLVADASLWRAISRGRK